MPRRPGSRGEAGVLALPPALPSRRPPPGLLRPGSWTANAQQRVPACSNREHHSAVALQTAPGCAIPSAGNAKHARGVAAELWGRCPCGVEVLLIIQQPDRIF